MATCVRRLYSTLSPLRVLASLEERGLLGQCTRVDSIEHSPGASVYVGFDPTADSLHTGNLLALVALLHFRHAGYQPIAVVGGATGLVGDPSGRVKEREQLYQDALERNVAGITETITRVFQNDQETQPREGAKELPQVKILNNADWWAGMTAVDFVSDISRHFRVPSMLAKESVKQRLNTDEGMSCAEFLYPIFQAYDFLHLHRHHKCWMQLGGGDQWGNITAGCEFVRKRAQSIVHGLTLPLITSSSGEKLGKSTGNAVWLSSSRSSSYNLYQHFVRTPDQDVGKFLSYFTFLPIMEIQEIVTEHLKTPEKFTAQKLLAESVTMLVHGEAGVQQAVNATAALFGDKEALCKLSGEELERLFSEAPTAELPVDLLEREPLSVLELAVKAKAVTSHKHGERLIQTGGLYVNFSRVTSWDEKLQKDLHVLPSNITILRVGKKNYTLVNWR